MAQIAKDERGNVFAAGESLRRLDPKQDRWSVIQHGAGGYTAVFPIAPGELLAGTVNDGLLRVTTEGAVLERVGESRLRHPTRIGFEPDWITRIFRDRAGQVWLTSLKGLFRLTGKNGALGLIRETLPNRSWKVPRAIDMEVDAENRLWTALHHGIFWREGDGDWQPLTTEPPLTRLQSFALGKSPDDDVWVTYDMPGRFSRVQRRDGRRTVSDLLPSEGYGPAETGFVRRDSRGWIWRASSSGLHVCDGRNTAPEDWILLTESRGLTSAVPRQHGFFEDSDGSIWIAGEQGVSHLYPDPSWFQAPRTDVAPRITRVELDGREIELSGLEERKAAGEADVLRIEVGSLEAPQLREYPFRYRVLPRFSDWRLSRDGVIEIEAPRPNTYRLEVVYTGTGPAPSLSQQFRIGRSRPPIPWIWSAGLLLLAIAAVGYRTAWFEGTRYRLAKLAYLTKLEHGPREDKPPPERAAGELLAGKYELLRRASDGGFSVLYEARSLTGIAPRVAVKIIKMDRSNEGWLRDRFTYEITALRTIEHPGVVRILDWWIGQAGEPCLVMPYLEGPTLRAATKDGPLPVRRVERLLRQVGSALSEVHRRGIVHRDLKPENVIVVGSGAGEQAVIVDFGAAGLKSADGNLAVTTMLAGSVRYMAPEQLTGHYSPASDIYSLGAIALELLTGRGLFNLGSHFSSGAFHGELSATLAAVVGTDAARELASVLSPAFNPEPDKRPREAAVWSNEMAEILTRL